MWNEKYIAKLDSYLAQAQAAGGAARVDKQHQSGKCTARERMEMLFDEGTFVEVGALRKSSNRVLKESKVVLGDGVVTGYGKVNGRLVFASSQDFTVGGGSLGQCHAEKICRVMDMAVEAGAPFVAMNDSGGARIDEGVFSLAGYSAIMARNVWASGVIPQIAVIMGPCAGGACYSPALSDFIFMTQNTSQMFLTGPAVVKQVMGENITAAELGGAPVHTSKSGVAHFMYEDDKKCLEGVRKLLSYLPQSNRKESAECNCKIAEAAKNDEGFFKKLFSKSESTEVAASFDNSASIQDIVPDNYKQAYDVKSVIAAFADADSFFEVQSDWGKNVVIGFARLNGEAIGIVANQPKVLAGSLDVDGSDKAGRFVRFCDAFNIPLLALADVPGYMPGSKQEYSGIIRHGAKLLYALRLCRSNRAEGDAHSAQGFRWRLHRHEQQGRGCRLRVRPPDCSGGRDGCRRCCGNHQQEGNRCGSGSGGCSRSVHRQVRRRADEPLRCRLHGCGRRSDSPGRCS